MMMVLEQEQLLFLYYRSKMNVSYEEKLIVYIVGLSLCSGLYFPVHMMIKVFQ